MSTTTELHPSEASAAFRGHASGPASAERAPTRGPSVRKVEISGADRGTILKYKADRGPVAYVLAMFVLHVLLWIYASPLVALAALVPLAVGSMFVAPIHHHHQHLNTFRAPGLNRVYDIVLALQTGVAPYSWVLHHNLGHHRNYLHQHPHAAPDESAWTRKDGSQQGRVEYTLHALVRHQRDIVRVGLKHRRYLSYWLLMKAPLYGLIALALWINAWNTATIFLIPGLIALAHTIWATYEHHSGCETHGHLVGSLNRDNRVYNLLTGNLGLHTAHHKRPGLHWSLLPQVHAEIKDHIPEHLILKNFW